MGCKELIEALRASGDEKLRALRAEAEQEAERLRAEAAGMIQEVRLRHARELQAEAAEAADALLAEAGAGARQLRIRAERELADRLFALARASLPVLRNEGYEAVFRSFAQELPRLSWKKVLVNPKDAALAASLFPGAEVLPDDAVTGGMTVLDEQDRVRVVNTFEKRLERKWEDLLPEIMREALELAR